MTTLRNNVQLIGNLGVDPEVKEFDSGKTKATIRLATSDSYTNKQGEKVENVDWHNLIAWGGTAKIVEKYLKKGSKVAVSGKLTYRNYDDKDGNTKYITEVIVNEIVMLGGKPE